MDTEGVKNYIIDEMNKIEDDLFNLDEDLWGIRLGIDSKSNVVGKHEMKLLEEDLDNMFLEMSSLFNKFNNIQSYFTNNELMNVLVREGVMESFCSLNMDMYSTFRSLLELKDLLKEVEIKDKLKVSIQFLGDDEIGK